MLIKANAYTGQDSPYTIAAPDRLLHTEHLPQLEQESHRLSPFTHTPELSQKV